jgi:hypothetical protein
MEKQLSDMFKEAGPEPTFSMAQIVEQLKSYGASVGADKAITAAGYGIAGLSGHAESGAMAVKSVNSLARDLYKEAVEKFGKKVVHSKKANNLARMQNFLKGHPKYGQLMQHLKTLPRHLLPKGNFMPPNINMNVAAARNFRKHVSLPLKKWNNSTRYVNSMAKQLNGRISLFKGIGRYATWYVPAVLGVVSVAAAPPELKMRRLFEQGFGILGGAIGTKAGGALGGFIAITVLGLGPFGWFVAVFVGASLAGIAGMELFNWGGGRIYDAGENQGGRIYHSFDELVRAF